MNPHKTGPLTPRCPMCFGKGERFHTGGGYDTYTCDKCSGDGMLEMMMADRVKHIQQYLEDQGVVSHLCGSRVTCIPVPKTADWDLLVHVPDDDVMSELVKNTLPQSGFGWEGDSTHYQEATGDGFVSWRWPWPQEGVDKRDTINLILTKCPEFVRRHKIATEYCRDRNILEKKERIAVFRRHLYDEDTSCD